MSEVRLHESWKRALSDQFEMPYFKSLISFVKGEYANNTIYPPGRLIFSALDHTPFEDVKVVILGQDPYHGPGQANGLSFSVNDGVAVPPSLKNIFTEIRDDLGIDTPRSGNLERWANQGVLLMNATLTVRAHEAGSHQKRGWEQFTDAAISAVSERRENVVFLLWGSYAQRKGAFINTQKHLVLKAPHPSPLSSYRGFFGCKHFSKANTYLKEKGKDQIIW